MSINHPLTNITFACAEPSLDYFQHLKLHAHVFVVFVLSPSPQCQNIGLGGGGASIFIYIYIYPVPENQPLFSWLFQLNDESKPFRMANDKSNDHAFPPKKRLTPSHCWGSIALSCPQLHRQGRRYTLCHSHQAASLVVVQQTDLHSNRLL